MANLRPDPPATNHQPILVFPHLADPYQVTSAAPQVKIER